MQQTVVGKKLYLNIQALRGIAALMVCFYHFRRAIVAPWGEIAFGNGWMGVQLFFMISGFIMVHTTSGITSNYTDQSFRFFLNRCLRIVPLYLIATLVYIAGEIPKGYIQSHGELLLRSLLFIVPQTSTKGPEYGMPTLEVGWTLNYEMMFYLLFAVSLLFGKLRYVFVYLIFVLLLVAVPLAGGFELSSSYKVFRDYEISYFNALTNPIWIHFIAGVSAGLLLKYVHPSRLFCRISLPVSIILFAIYYTGCSGLEINAVNDLLFGGILFIAFLINDMHEQGYRFPHALNMLGNISYSLYLFHPIVLSYLFTLLLIIGQKPWAKTPVFLVVAITTAIGISFLVHKLLEVRITRALKQYLFRN